MSKHRKCLLTCAGHNATLVPHTCCSGRHGGDTGPKRNGVRLVGVLCIILAFVLSWVMIICCFARWRGEGRFAKQTKEAPLAVVGKVFDLEQPVSTKSFVFSEDTLTSVDDRVIDVFDGNGAPSGPNNTLFVRADRLLEVSRGRSGSG